ncbi:hypothetical protein SAMN05444156_0530 [Verrucomicrobium sp. GAS474]|uniref:hypothetical protein n=1 Tax=Verrucomicrobium sp. GAS474 TaxID=1882831 RepID=UPI000879BC0A|nr:hypothetical protein [Verrucomicrobium sp. GAS474]SDT89674.1 hypothetical protein SAMN05444156_0530 [Verrucomicrobium sp. GAS474]
MNYQEQFDQMVEYVGSYFAREKTENMARREFLREREELLRSVPSIDAETLGTNPYYAAIGFLGFIRFTEGPELKDFDILPSPTALAALRQSGGVTMEKSAVPVWIFLEKNHPDAALAAVVLASMGRKNETIKKALK